MQPRHFVHRARRLACGAVAVVALLASPVPAGAALDAADGPGFDVLVFSKTADFRHASIADGVAAIESLGAAHGFTVEATEDARAFTPDELAPYEAVVFLNTTGDVLDDAEEAAFEHFIEGGGGFVGIHAAADTEYDWSWYGGLLGAYYLRHPPGRRAPAAFVGWAAPHPPPPPPPPP